MAKYAIIINGDTEARHTGNVDRALRVLEKEGCETFVAGTSAPTVHADHYVEASKDNIEKMIADAKAKMGEGDELVIYVTGHGDPDGFCLADDCGTKGLIARLDGIPYGKRTVVMDQCYGANFARRFTDDPNTLFVSAGSFGETTCCTDFAPFFWGEDVPDINRDGYVSFQERYAAVKNLGKGSLTSQYIPTGGYVEEGRPAFGDQVVEVNDKAELDAALKKLGPGQRAIVLFSADFCAYCREYEPKFEKMPEQTKGQYLFIRTKNEELAQGFGVEGYPTVAIFDAEGHARKVANRNNVLAKLGEFSLTPSERATELQSATQNGDEGARYRAVDAIGELLTSNELPEEQEHALVDRLIDNLYDVDASVRMAAARNIARVTENCRGSYPPLSLEQAELAAFRLRRMFSVNEAPDDRTEYDAMLSAMDCYGKLVKTKFRLKGRTGRPKHISSEEVRAGARELRKWFGSIHLAVANSAYQAYIKMADRLEIWDLQAGAEAIPPENLEKEDPYLRPAKMLKVRIFHKLYGMAKEEVDTGENAYGGDMSDTAKDLQYVYKHCGDWPMRVRAQILIARCYQELGSDFSYQAEDALNQAENSIYEGVRTGKIGLSLAAELRDELKEAGD